MIKIILIASVLFSINLKSQTNIVQTLSLLKNDSCLIITKIETKEGKGYKAELKCKYSDYDSLKVIERKRAKLIAQNFDWKNN